MIVDFHTHCYADTVAQKARHVLPEGSQFGPFYDCTLGGLLDSMKKNGIDMSLTLHIANTPHAVKKVNDWAITCNQTPNIRAFGSVHPQYPDYKSEIARLKDAGIKGLKFHPYYQKFDCDDRSVYPVYEEAAKQGMIMLFHCGYDMMVEGAYCTPDKFARMASDFGGATIVAAHLGGWDLWDEAFELFLGKDIYLDTSFAFRFLTDEKRRILLDNHSPDRLLFGTDGPWVDSADDVAVLRGYVSGEKADKIFYKNALHLLGEKI